MLRLPRRIPGLANAREQELAGRYHTVRTIGRAHVTRGGTTCPPRNPANPVWSPPRSAR